MTQIPIYRAKKLNSDEWVEGYCYADDYTRNIVNYDVDEPFNTEIDQSTLSIHFSNMLDSNNNKIFASLSEDGKGGDILKDLNSWYIIYDNKNGCFIGKEINSINLKLNLHYWNFKDCTITGIKQ